MFERRTNEPDYALLRDPVTREVNCYGAPIDTVGADDPRRGASLNINSDSGIGENPNRYKQHGFYFNADNCIACHACEAACSEKNDNPAHIAFRSVGFVEGGTYPAYQRLNISMACNHCDDPVCLRGCPTRAYTKFAEYGAVLQDPDICFGCGYCTWVCPYNAPQLDPVKGQVTKCNMCVDRLEVGLKPACVTACLGNALDFGVIENVPERREQAKTGIPGFPRTDITHPNIRFQQTRTPQRDMYRVDQSPLKYHRDDSSGNFRPKLDRKHGDTRQWNLSRLLGSHENAHIAFTLSTQAVMGAFLILLAGFAWPPLAAFTHGTLAMLSLPVMLVVLSFGLFRLNMHLGKPHRFYRGFYNLRLSPVSREIAGVSAFFTGLAGVTFVQLTGWDLYDILWYACTAIALLGVIVGGFYMYRLYRIEARPFWNHWYTGASFIATGLMLGSTLLLLIAALAGTLSVAGAQTLLAITGGGILLEIAGLLGHGSSLRDASSEGAASYYVQTTRYGNAFRLRNILLVTGLAFVTTLLVTGTRGTLAALTLGTLLLAATVLGRALFYVVVIPTTMPGAFFWKNQGFIEHAREIGLAGMQQLGVAYETHHRFDVGALIDTLRTTTTRQKLDQLRSIFSG